MLLTTVYVHEDCVKMCVKDLKCFCIFENDGGCEDWDWTENEHVCNALMPNNIIIMYVVFVKTMLY